MSVEDLNLFSEENRADVGKGSEESRKGRMDVGGGKWVDWDVVDFQTVREVSNA